MSTARRLEGCWCAYCMGIRRGVLLGKARLPITVALADRLCLTKERRISCGAVRISFEGGRMVERYHYGTEQR